jgi:hypothetical protein
VPAAHTPGSIAKINHAYSPTPLGHDLFAEFGDERSLPIVGNFDPPLSAATIAQLSKSMGDFDGNGKVDQADYNVWRSTFGSTTNLAADANGNGIIDSGDYSMWRDHMGQTVPGAGSGAAAETLQAAQLQVLGPASSSGGGSAAADAPAEKVTAATASVAQAAPLVVPPPNVSNSTVVESAQSVTSSAQRDQALLLLLNDPQPAAAVLIESAELARSSRESGDNASDSASGETLAAAWQSWGEI